MAYVTRTNGTTYQLQVTGGLENLLGEERALSVARSPESDYWVATGAGHRVSRQARLTVLVPSADGVSAASLATALDAALGDAKVLYVEGPGGVSLAVDLEAYGGVSIGEPVGRYAYRAQLTLYPGTVYRVGALLTDAGDTLADEAGDPILHGEEV